MVLLLSSTAGSFCTSAHDEKISQELWVNTSSECFNCTPRQTCGAWHLKVSDFGYPALSASCCLAAGSPQLLSSWVWSQEQPLNHLWHQPDLWRVPSPSAAAQTSP